MDPVLAAGALHHLAVVVVVVIALVTQWTEVPWRETGSQQGVRLRFVFNGIQSMSTNGGTIRYMTKFD